MEDIPERLASNRSIPFDMHFLDKERLQETHVPIAEYRIFMFEVLPWALERGISDKSPLCGPVKS
eukprot:15324539-Ditylum_brightwellii.AAC.1